MADLIGQSFGCYQIVEQLGEGGMAANNRVFDTLLERNVALKVIISGKEGQEYYLKCFEW